MTALTWALLIFIGTCTKFRDIFLLQNELIYSPKAGCSSRDELAITLGYCSLASIRNCRCSYSRASLNCLIRKIISTIIRIEISRCFNKYYILAGYQRKKVMQLRYSLPWSIRPFYKLSLRKTFATKPTIRIRISEKTKLSSSRTRWIFTLDLLNLLKMSRRVGLPKNNSNFGMTHKLFFQWELENILFSFTPRPSIYLSPA